ncbi:MAG: HlyD family efflux transporter periplasmic adaptor subunit [Planctomycetaceae bacterium]|jgi:multidrug efflux pump subunit AcrA (membrane-fusion protein)|nr:HlyD family efflux transporter periplasmic adaptor subunit [Planctomycetaceae bacterium]
MKQFTSLLFRGGISLALVILTGLVICKGMVSQQIHRRYETPEAGITVEAVPIVKHDAGINFSVDGEVIPFRRVDLVAEIAGRVIDKSENCRLGKSVRKGEVLMRIDPVDYQLEQNKAEQSVKQAEVNISENAVLLANTEKELKLAMEQLELSQKDYNRNVALVEKNTITPADLDNARSQWLSAQENVAKLENQLRVYQTQTDKHKNDLSMQKLALETARLNLQRTEVKAPIDGVITSDVFEVNSFIQRGADIAKILDISQLEIQCSLYMKQIQWIWRQSSEADAGYVFPPTPVTIVYENEGEKWGWEGELKTLDGGLMNAATRMMPCRIKAGNPGSGKLLKTADTGESVKPPMLIAGMYVTVIVHSKPAIPLCRIPERALLPGNRIWTVIDGKLHQHTIRVAATMDNGVLFYADAAIKADDLVVVSPLATPVEGGLVTVKNKQKYNK